jgi:hypothetical protein
MNLIKRTIIIPATGLLLLSGCADHSAKDAISKFQTASAVVIANAEAEYTSANKKERDAEIDTRIYLGQSIEPGIFFGEELLVIKHDDLKARLDALAALKEHGNLLLALVNSNAPNDAKNAVNSLDDAVLNLKNSLKKASPDQEFRDKAGAFAVIAGEVSKLVMEKKIKKALDKAIILSEEVVTPLINLLQQEMLNHFPQLQRGSLSNTFAARIKSYNKELPSNLEKRKKAGAEIKKAGDAWEALLFRPDPGFETMKQAHKTLVSYAKSDKTPQNLEELVAAMDAFTERAKIIADSIKTIQQ